MVGVRAKDHEDKRQRILEAAAHLFATRGFHDTSIAEISAACDASKAWVYHYYTTKDEILFALLTDFLQTVVERVRRVLEPKATPTDRFRAFVRECFLIYSEYRIDYPVLMSEATCLGEVEQKSLKKIERDYVAMLSDIVRALNPKLGGRSAKLTPVTLLVFGTVNWTYTWYNPDGPLSLDTLVDMTVKLLLPGLQSLD